MLRNEPFCRKQPPGGDFVRTVFAGRSQTISCAHYSHWPSFLSPPQLARRISRRKPRPPAATYKCRGGWGSAHGAGLLGIAAKRGLYDRALLGGSRAGILGAALDRANGAQKGSAQDAACAAHSC